MKTAEEIIQSHYNFYDSNLQFRDIELNGEQVMKLMEEYAAQFSHPPAAPVKLDKTGEYYPGLEHQRLFNAIEQTKGLPLVSEMQDIIKIVHEDFPAEPVSGEELKASDELMYMIERAALESLEKIDWLNYPKDMFRAGAKWALSATLPTREQGGEKEKFAIRFSEWLMIQCEYKNHCVWEYRGEEYTQNELIEIFKRTTPLPSPPKH